MKNLTLCAEGSGEPSAHDLIAAIDQRTCDALYQYNRLGVHSFTGLRIEDTKNGETGNWKRLSPRDPAIQGIDVLMVEDIVDTGLTLRYLLNVLKERQPNSLAVCTFVDKAIRRLVDIPVKYRCFEIPDRFVVGFGLDYDQRYRNLPCLGILRKEIYQKL
jgi:hypoxanthine phosphoribosyltransferase